MEKAALKMSYKDWELKFRLQLTGYNSQQLYMDLVNAKKKPVKKSKKK